MFGIGLRSEHIADFYHGCESPMGSDFGIDFLEIHAENFLDLGSPRARALLRIREDYPISCHAVGLSLGSAEGVDSVHLAKVKALVDVLHPLLFSDHVSWSVSGGYYLNDLLPLPLAEESLSVLCANIGRVQDVLGREILLENPSSYVSFGADSMSESEFMRSLSSRSGCSILLDLNNVYVSSENHGFSVADYLRDLAGSRVGEIHLAGHVSERIGDRTVRIDTHDRAVCSDVWSIFSDYVASVGDALPPVLIEWDSAMPALSVLLGECDKARRIACAS